MNFLGHAYIARNHPELIAGNFAGDSYKGYLDNFKHLPLDVLNGIKLHRFIDDFTDHNENIVQVAAILKESGLSKISFIACDILLDHFLSRDWQDYSTISYQEFVNFIYESTDAKLDDLEEEFNHLYKMLKQYGWMFDYQNIEGISKILKQFSTRIPFENELAKASEVYVIHQKEIDICFKTFISEIDIASQKFILENLS